MIKDKMYLGRGFADAAQFILLLLLISIFQTSLGQGAITQDEDSTSISLPKVQGLPLLNDSSVVDSIAAPTQTDVIDASIFYDAEDSIVFDLFNGKVLLYGNAVVNYDGLEVKAEIIEYDFANTIACASGILDSAGVMTGKPQLSDDGQNFTQEFMCYNFKTKEGFSKVSVTQDGDAVFHAAVSKRHANEWIHIKKGKFTTCDAENPHYHFRLSKAIIVPDDKVVSGPLYMKVRKVPVPLGLPFAWFPTQNKQSHGVILPGYGNANNLGYFLKDGGYYFPIGRTVDTRILGDIYSRGSWSLKNITSYKKRYRFNGNLNISRTIIKSGFPELASYSESTEFGIKWTHNQDPKARPNSRFSANVNIFSRGNFRNQISTSQQDFLSNTFTSSVQYNQSFPGRPWSLGISARHSQNNTSGTVDLTLPSITLNRNRTYLPLGVFGFNRQQRTKLDKLVAFTYSANFDNLLNTQSDRVRLDNIGPLARDLKTLNSQVKAAFVTITPNFTYNEYCNFKEIR
ncbi:MAG: LPS-assembly protein LptD [Flavobacteriales bacterium]|nr:LPS-assembly protein LptD [Flavobacteriales bacterium]